MKKSFPILTILALLAGPAIADTADDLDAWFRDGYAALYVESAWEHGDEFGQYFTDVIVYRSDEGLEESSVDGFVVDSLEVWRSEGWLGTDVAALDTVLLNATTAVFHIQWSDRYADGSTELSCGQYYADKADGQWLLSMYIATACSD